MQSDLLSNQRILLIMCSSVKSYMYLVHLRQPKLINELEHQLSRLKTSELMSDDPGRYITSYNAYDQFVPPHDPHTEEQKNFAKEISDYLENGRQQNLYDKVILCAEPHFLGLLNKAMNKHVASVVINSVKKDYIPLPENERIGTVQKVINDSMLNN